MTEERFVHPIVRPMDGVAGRTSEWRTTRPALYEYNCIKCMKCVVHCPDDCFYINDDGIPVIIQEYCKGCQICTSVCPTNAIVEIPVLPGGEIDAVDPQTLAPEPRKKRK